jgi:hypothetical protein
MWRCRRWATAVALVDALVEINARIGSMACPVAKTRSRRNAMPASTFLGLLMHPQAQILDAVYA